VGAGGAANEADVAPAASAAGSRRRILLLLLVVLLVFAGAGAYAVSAFKQQQSSQASPPAVEVAQAHALPPGTFIMFRNTAAGQGYGQAAVLGLSDLGGVRALTGKVCDRVHASRRLVSCLATRNEIPTKFELTTYDATLQSLQTSALGGIPSRTRISPDGTLVATTVFVSGHSYASAGFSTETIIRGTDGTDHGNLEDFALLSGGSRIKASDRNIWGVTFVPGKPAEFYATASSQGSIWLVKGDLEARTLTVVTTGVECPSISPDGQRIAFKKSESGTLVGERHPAVLDIATGHVSVLAEKRNIDDQIEWLDNGTLLYGIPRDDTGQDSDVWMLSTDDGAAPQLFIQHAWSPAVVR